MHWAMSRQGRQLSEELKVRGGRTLRGPGVASATSSATPIKVVCTAPIARSSFFTFLDLLILNEGTDLG